MSVLDASPIHVSVWGDIESTQRIFSMFQYNALSCVALPETDDRMIRKLDECLAREIDGESIVFHSYSEERGISLIGKLTSGWWFHLNGNCHWRDGVEGSVWDDGECGGLVCVCSMDRALFEEYLEDNMKNTARIFKKKYLKSGF
jgi:hypothetical protein